LLPKAHDTGRNGLARVASDNQASENVGVNGAHVAPDRPAGSRLSVIGSSRFQKDWHSNQEKEPQ